jgi:broad specificity phosphatase PhoE
MQLYLIRHTKTVLNSAVDNRQWQLSAEGITLANEFAQKSELQKLQVLYSSEQTKALHTAILIASPHFIPLKVEAGLAETTSLTNGFFENYNDTMARWYTEKGFRINNGETYEETLARFNSAIERIVAANEDKEYIGLVSHANALSCFSAQFEERTPLDIHHSLQMPDYAILDWNTKSFIKRFSHD